jgi:hypothetical protein
MEFPTMARQCEICAAEVEMPVDLFGTMAQMPRLVSRTFREPRTHRGVGWTPHEVAAHLADIEVTLGWRIRQVLAEDEPMLQPFDQDLWATSLEYGRRELATSLATYAANRQANLELMRRAGDAGMNRPFRHPEFGNRPLTQLIEHISHHDIDHLRQIQVSDCVAA